MEIDQWMSGYVTFVLTSASQVPLFWTGSEQNSSEIASFFVNVMTKLSNLVAIVALYFYAKHSCRLSSYR